MYYLYEYLESCTIETRCEVIVMIWMFSFDVCIDEIKRTKLKQNQKM